MIVIGKICKTRRDKMKKIKVKVGVDKSKLIKGDKRIVACGKNF